MDVYKIDIEKAVIATKRSIKFLLQATVASEAYFALPDGLDLVVRKAVWELPLDFEKSSVFLERAREAIESTVRKNQDLLRRGVKKPELAAGIVMVAIGLCFALVIGANWRSFFGM